MEQPTGTPTRAAAAVGSLAVEAFVTLVAALFALLALDDITTDNATTGFKPEYWLLALCGAWVLCFVVQLWRNHRRVPAMISLLLLGAAAWVSADGIGHKRDGGWNVFWPEYSVIVVAWLWFLAAAVILLRQAFRRASSARVST
jgi:hypothetical protein